MNEERLHGIYEDICDALNTTEVEAECYNTEIDMAVKVGKLLHEVDTKNTDAQLAERKQQFEETKLETERFLKVEQIELEREKIRLEREKIEAERYQTDAEALKARKEHRLGVMEAWIGLGKSVLFLVGGWGLAFLAEEFKEKDGILIKTSEFFGQAIGMIKKV